MAASTRDVGPGSACAARARSLRPLASPPRRDISGTRRTSSRQPLMVTFVRSAAFETSAGNLPTKKRGFILMHLAADPMAASG